MKMRSWIFGTFVVFALAVRGAAACTITVGQYWPNNPYPSAVSGYSSGTLFIPGGYLSLGSISGAVLPDGRTIENIMTVWTGGSLITLEFDISGFSSDPGKNYLSSLSLTPSYGINPGVPLTYSTSESSVIYAYGNGRAHWEWGRSTAVYGAYLQPVGNTYSCVVSY